MHPTRTKKGSARIFKFFKNSSNNSERLFGWWWRRLRRLKSKADETILNIEQDQAAAEKLPYPISISRKPTYSTTVPPGGGVENFDTPEASNLNRARLEHLYSLGLSLQGKRVLDAGCGVGHLGHFLQQQGCNVLCIDARIQNIARLNELYPGLRAMVMDLEKDDVQELGRFDIVFAYGVLYHLENPFQALRRLAAICDESLLLETMVADHFLPLVRFAEETLAYSQALRNVGSRPTPSFLVLALRSAGFEYVYAPRTPPDHPDFLFTWKNDLSDSRDGHLLRCIFVASRHPLETPTLVSLFSKSDPENS